MGLIPVLWAGGETSSLTRADQAILMVWDGFAPDGFAQGFAVLNTTGMSGVTGACFKKSHRFWRKPYRTPECEPYVGPNTTWRVADVGKELRPQLCVFLWVPRPTRAAKVARQLWWGPAPGRPSNVTFVKNYKQAQLSLGRFHHPGTHCEISGPLNACARRNRAT